MHWLEDGLNLPVWAHAAGAIVLLDAWTYLWHRMNHEIPVFSGGFTRSIIPIIRWM